ncbi:MAG: GNAT family N-acetyltransferase, partial [Vallitaleaceae bacterium]|nr:GNAT family N-acetyltransferase [Vallitaleaceae bacterium]
DIPPLTQSLEEIIGDFANHIFLKVVEEGVIIGSIRGYEDSGTCYIGRVIVADDYQNRGIGTQLLDLMEKEFKNAKRYELFTGKKSVRNLYLYRKLGYEEFKEVELNDKTTLVFLEKINES